MSGSFFADFGMPKDKNGPFSTSDNWLRALIATPQFGLASMWAFEQSLLQLDGLTLGDPIGTCFARTVNNPAASLGTASQDYGFNVTAYKQRQTDLNLLGDPTLRMHVLAAPAVTLNGNTVQWSGGESGADYFIYRSTTGSLGPFIRQTSSAVTGNSWTDPSPPGSSAIYMVKARKLHTTGNGSYYNLSLGGTPPHQTKRSR